MKRLLRRIEHLRELAVIAARRGDHAARHGLVGCEARAIDKAAAHLECAGRRRILVLYPDVRAGTF